MAVLARRGTDGADRGVTDGQGARLVEDDGVDTAGRLEGGATPDEHATLGGATRAHHHGGGRGQPHGAGTGDDEHTDGRDQRQGEGRFWSEGCPGHERRRRQHDDRGHEPLDDAIGHTLDGRLRSLRLAHHAHDLAQHGVTADVGGAQHDGAAPVEGGADDHVAGTAGDRQRLTGEHRLVDAAAAVHDDTVDRHLLTGSDAHEVAGSDSFDGHVQLDVTVDAPSGARTQSHQGGDRATGLRLGTCLHPAAGEDEADDHGRRIEVRDRLDAGVVDERGRQCDGHAVAPRGHRPQRHQRVHRDRAMPRLPPGVAQEHAAGPELHERGRHEQQPVELHHAQAERARPQHQRHDGHGQQHRDQGADAQLAHLSRPQVGIGVGVVQRQRRGGQGGCAVDARRSRLPRWPRPPRHVRRPQGPHARWRARWPG